MWRSSRKSQRRFETLETRCVLDSTVVINEVMYNPTDVAQSLEWVELYNQLSVDIDLTGWSLDGGTNYRFPQNTVIGGGEYLVVARSPEALTAETGLTDFWGPYERRLGNGGDRLLLRDNSQRIMSEVDYDDRGQWPVGADGSGASLAKADPYQSSEQANNWSFSSQIGGSPGQPNDVQRADLIINELSAAGDRFEVEFYNSGAGELDLANYSIRVGSSERVSLPNIEVPADGFGSVQIDALGLTVAAGEPIFLYTADGSQLVDAVEAQSRIQARFPDGTDHWRYSVAATFGRANQVQLRDEVVINEIMFNHRDVPAAQAVTEELPLIDLTSAWRFDDSGTDLGVTWRQPDFNDSNWSTGSGFFGDATVELPNPIDTQLQAGRSTYYFRTTFDLDSSVLDLAAEDLMLNLRSLVDDGAVVYLNGHEVTRVNMPAGEINHTTLALVGVSDPHFTDIEIDGQYLVHGNNVLAIEVHQAPETVAYYRFEDAGPGGRDVIDALTGQDHGDMEGKAGLSEDVPGDVVPNTGQANTQSYYAQADGRGIGFALMNPDNVGVPFIFNDPEGPATLEWYMKVPVEERHNPIFWTDTTGAGTGFNIFYNSSFTGEPNTNRVVAGGLEGDIQIIGNYVNDRPLELDTWHHLAIVRTDLGNGRLRWRWYIDGIESESHGRVTQGGPWPNMASWSLTGRPGQAFNVLIDELRMSKEALTPDQFLNSEGGTVGVGGDVAFATRLSLVKTIEPATERHESQEEWIELFNRSEQSIDLGGWSLTDAVQLSFTDGTVLGPGEYAVVARDVEAMQSRFPDVRYLGAYGGQLNNRTERIVLRDAIGNPADEVRYYDGKPWPAYADGRHSSLELIDPDADNSKPEAWAASNESIRSQWHQYSYRGVAGPGDSGSPDYHELVIGMLDQGEVLIDDVMVIEEPELAARQLIQNGTFETGDADKWRVIGNHSAVVVQDPDDPSNHALHLVATGRTDDIHNHAETTLKFGSRFVEVTPGTEYEISFQAKWLGGSNQLHTRLYFNELPHTNELIASLLQGTPGQRNSVAEENIGPTYSRLSHAPVIPDVDEPVTVSVQASDADSIASLILHYLAGSEWQTVAMTNTEGSTFEGIIPGQSSRTKVQFYVAGTDVRGATSLYPSAGPESRAMFVVQDGRAQERLNNLRVVMNSRDASRMLRATQLMSNQRLGATVIYNESEVYYDVDIRLSGASSSRQTINNGYSIQFRADQLFLGVHDNVTIDRNNLNEIFVRHLINRAGDVPGMYNDAIYFVGPLTSRVGYAQLRMARYDDVYLSSQFEDGNEGLLFEKELTYRQSISRPSDRESLKVPQGYTHPVELNTDLQDFGDNKEAYRWHWLPKNHRDQDDFEQIIALNQAFSLSGAQLDRATGEVLDVDQWLRTFATMRLFGNRDFYSQPSGSQGHWRHNLFVYVRPTDEKVLVLPWDIDESFQISTSSTLFGVGNLTKMIQLPDNLHYYYGHMHDVMQQSFNDSYLSRWSTHFASLFTTANFSTPRSYINSRTNFVQSRLPDEVEFSVLTPVETIVDAPTIRINGEGWINVREIRVAGQAERLDVRWTSPTKWVVDLPLAPGENRFEFAAYDFQGNLIESPFENVLEITSTEVSRPQLDHLRITEINYHPFTPTDAEIAAGFDRADDFVFIEVTNTGSLALDLVGARFIDGIAYDFTTSSIEAIDPGETALIVEDIDAFRFRYGDGFPIAGQWTGGLSRNGEQLTLVDQFGRVVHDFTYQAQSPWPQAPNGRGSSLAVVNTEGDYDAADNWSASVYHGTPGIVPVGLAGDFDGNHVLDAGDIDRLSAELRSGNPPIAWDLTSDEIVDTQDRDYLVEQLLETNYGDANLDRIFNSDDFVFVFIVGEFNDGIPGNSTWSEGDWDGDGDFGTDDFVKAFIAGGYTYANQPAVRSTLRSDANLAMIATGVDADREHRTGAGQSDVRAKQLVFQRLSGQDELLRRPVLLDLDPLLVDTLAMDHLKSTSYPPAEDVTKSLDDLLRRTRIVAAAQNLKR